jgi:hypothetical protein
LLLLAPPSAADVSEQADFQHDRRPVQIFFSIRCDIAQVGKSTPCRFALKNIRDTEEH